MQKLLDCHGPVEDPSPVARANRSLLLGEADSLLSYKATSTLITASSCCFSNRDIDPHLLFLLKVYCFFVLSTLETVFKRLNYLYCCYDFMVEYVVFIL